MDDERKRAWAQYEEEAKRALDEPNQVVLNIAVRVEADATATANVVVLRNGQYALPTVGDLSYASSFRSGDGRRMTMPSPLDVRNGIKICLRNSEMDVAKAKAYLVRQEEMAYLVRKTLEAFDERYANELACDILGDDEV